MSLEGYEGPRVLLSYDVVGAARSVASRVCQIVFGRMRMDRGPEGVGRREAGFIHRPGVVWVGQSVLILPPADAEDLAGRLRRLGVRVTKAPVGISAGALRAFRRTAPGWA
jgi:hypothetical protein